MSTNILHLMPPPIHDEIGAIAGDMFALKSLRLALEDAIESGTGGALFAQSDGAQYFLPIVLADEMCGVNTAYRELHPVRSPFETIPMRAIPNFLDALAKAWPTDQEGNHVRLSLLRSFAVQQNAMDKRRS